MAKVTNPQGSGSVPGKLDKDDLVSILKGAGIAALGGLGAWISVTLLPQLQASGSTTAIALSGVLAVAVNVIRKLVSDNAAR